MREATLVALTGFANPDIRRRARHAGIDLYLVKPVDPGRLQALLSEMAAERRVSPGRRSGWLSQGVGLNNPFAPHKEVQPCWF